MSATRRSIRAGSSIRIRFLLVVFVAAVVPLALIGVWLTRSVVRAGEDLLHGELDGSLASFAGAVTERWSYREGDLALLAANEVAERGVAGMLSAADSAYLGGVLFPSVSQTVMAFEYDDPSGRTRWQTPKRSADSARAPRVGETPGPAMRLEYPVLAPGGKVLGRMVATVSPAALMPTDTSLRLPHGARLQVIQRSNQLDLLPILAADSLLFRSQFVSDGLTWLAVHRSLIDPGIDLALAAPLDDYVRPFERVARTGGITLAIVSLFALAFSAYLTTRLTASLGRLAVAADAVAAGDLEHRVDGSGGDEVGRVGTAFNSMIDNLRRTLGELSHRQALAAVGEYAAAMSHEVRNGLTAVRVDLQNAEEKTPAELPSRSLIARALESVKRLDVTVSASLRAARSSRTPRRRIDLRVVLRAAASAAEGAFNERGATIAPAADGEATWVFGDAMALEQLFLNLLINAAQALGRGGRATIEMRLDGADACVVVADRGVGIAPADLERVLDPFFSTKPDGTGLGLSIARQTAVAHGGGLGITSAPGVGTRVEVRLPLAGAPSA